MTEVKTQLDTEKAAMFVDVPTKRNQAQGSYHSTQPMLTVIDSCLVFYSVL